MSHQLSKRNVYSAWYFWLPAPLFSTKIKHCKRHKRTRGLSSACHRNLLKSYQVLTQILTFIFRILAMIKLHNLNQASAAKYWQIFRPDASKFWLKGEKTVILRGTNLFKNLSKSPLSESFFELSFGDFRGREPDLYSEFSDFKNLSVFSNFSAWNNIVGQRYR